VATLDRHQNENAIAVNLFPVVPRTRAAVD
jgi:hypothetical protein